jgi:integrase
MRFAIKMKVVASQREKHEGRRATFTGEEWNVLTRNLLSWAEGKGKYADGRLNAFHRHHRQQLRFYVLFLASTGIRSGTETRFMRWEDIGHRDVDGTHCLKIGIRSKTKRGTRTVISQANAVDWMKEWKSISHYKDDQDYVWYGMSKENEKQKVATDLNKTFQSFLKSVAFRGRIDGLLFDADSKRRSLYSLRHFYATQRIQSGVSYEDLTKQMGTGIEQLVKHYDWATTEHRAAEITKTKYATKKSIDVERLVGNLTKEQKEELKRMLQV